jgi:hypothetical protein
VEDILSARGDPAPHKTTAFMKHKNGNNFLMLNIESIAAVERLDDLAVRCVAIDTHLFTRCTHPAIDTHRSTRCTIPAIDTHLSTTITCRVASPARTFAPFFYPRKPVIPYAISLFVLC